MAIQLYTHLYKRSIEKSNRKPSVLVGNFTIRSQVQYAGYCIEFDTPLQTRPSFKC